MKDILLPPVNQRIKNAINELYNGSVRQFSMEMGLKDYQKINRLFLIDKRNGKYPTPSTQILKDISNKIDISIEWLLYGKGEMMKQGASNSLAANEEIELIPLLPIAAQGGSLNDFVVSVKDSDCERIVSPIKGADFAITVSGSSMEPEYPSGSKILIKKINEESFIEWGRCYVLDTCNGIVVKKLAAPVAEDPNCGYDYVTCISVNPDPIYAPFNVPKKDIFGIYRVLMQLTEK